MIRKICCIGSGYVGGPTMAVIALKCPNLKVTVIDSDEEKIKKWNGQINNLPVYEPGLKEIIEKVRNVNLHFTNKIKESINEAEIIFIAVNTPTKIDGEGAGMAADLTNIEVCAKQIAKFSVSDKIVVEKSTVPVRSAEKVLKILNKFNSNVNFEVLSNPEFLAEGTAIKDLLTPDRVLIGSNQTTTGKKASQKLVDIYSKWVHKEKIITTNVWSSELSKLASNAMLAQRISSINSLSALCEKTGADIDELSKAIGSDHRIGKHFLKASVGFGGSCFQKDILNLVYLCRHYNLDSVAEYWLNIVKINDYQKDRFTDKVIDFIKKENKKKIATILGWSFKANTNDTRESPSIQISRRLLQFGFSLRIYDPKVEIDKIFKDLDGFSNSDYQVFNNMNEAMANSSAILIITEWDEFKSIKTDKISKNKKIFDGRRILEKRDNIYSLGS